MTPLVALFATEQLVWLLDSALGRERKAGISAQGAAEAGGGWRVKHSCGSPRFHTWQRKQAASPASPGRNNPGAGREKRRASAGFTRIPGAASNRKKYRSQLLIFPSAWPAEQSLCVGGLVSCPSGSQAGAGGCFGGLRAVLPMAGEGRDLSSSMRWGRGAKARSLALGCSSSGSAVPEHPCRAGL